MKKKTNGKKFKKNKKRGMRAGGDWGDLRGEKVGIIVNNLFSHLCNVKSWIWPRRGESCQFRKIGHYATAQKHFLLDV